MPLHTHRLDAPRASGVWEDSDTDGLINWLAREYALDMPVTKATSGMLQAALATGYHPVREYLNGLVWDGVPRLDGWLTRYLGAAATPYTALAGAYWLISAVARVMVPGAQVDHVLILEGKQGGGKSSALRILGGNYYRSTRININRAPDCYQALRGAWIYEFAEIASFKRADADELKAYLSEPADDYRDSYGRGTRKYPRQVVFGGSVNPDEARACTYLTDPTGGRRFWPVACFATCERADLIGLQKNRDQLWAEAVARYHAAQIHPPHVSATWRIPSDVRAAPTSLSHCATDVSTCKMSLPVGVRVSMLSDTLIKSLALNTSVNSSLKSRTLRVRRSRRLMTMPVAFPHCKADNARCRPGRCRLPPLAPSSAQISTRSSSYRSQYALIFRRCASNETPSCACICVLTRT